jgi:hypothetical protein
MSWRFDRMSLHLFFLILGFVFQPARICGALSFAQGAQIIGDTEDGGGIVRAAVDMLRILDPDAVSKEEPGAQSVRSPLSDIPEVKDFGEVTPVLNSVEDARSDDALSDGLVKPRLDHAQQWSFGACTAFLWEDNSVVTRGFALHHNGKLVEVRSGSLYVTGPGPGPKNDFTTVPGPTPGTDIDGNGIPDLLLYEFSGGAHCCYTVWHIECGERPSVRCGLYTGHSQPVFEDMDGDGRLEARLVDTSFAYWNECFVASPFPPVILRIRNNHYEMAEEIMRAQGPSAAEVEEQGRKLRTCVAYFSALEESLLRDSNPPDSIVDCDGPPMQAWRNGHVTVPSSVWGIMLDLIYSGRNREAIAFLETVWPKGKPGREDFTRDVAELVLESWYGRRLPWIAELKRLVDDATRPVSR